MAAIATEFVARYSSQRVRQLTLADNQDSNAYDATKLATAVVDATAEFATLVGVELDTDDAAHVRVACLLTETFLLEYGAGTSAEAEKVRGRAEKAAAALGKVTSRDRVSPTTSAPWTPTERAATALPDFDIRRFTDQIPNLPGGSSDDLDPQDPPG